MVLHNAKPWFTVSAYEGRRIGFYGALFPSSPQKNFGLSKMAFGGTSKTHKHLLDSNCHYCVVTVG